MKFKTIAMTGVMSLAGLGLIGAGAHAVFTASATTVQTITAGTPTVVTWAADASNGCTTQAIALDNPGTCYQVILSTATVGSTFDTVSDVGVLNTGNIPVSLSSIGVTDNNGAFEPELGMCIDGSGMLYNNTLGAFPDLYGTYTYPTPVSTLAVGAVGTYYVDFYAGQASSVCGGSAIPSLTTGAEGGSVTTTVTVTYNS